MDKFQNAFYVYYFMVPSAIGILSLSYYIFFIFSKIYTLISLNSCSSYVTFLQFYTLTSV